MFRLRTRTYSFHHVVQEPYKVPVLRWENRPCSDLRTGRASLPAIEAAALYGFKVAHYRFLRHMDIGLERLLGCSIHDPKLKDVVQLLEDRPTPSENYSECKNWYCINFFRTGVSLLVDPKRRISCIAICTRPRPRARYNAYPYQLPHGLTADMSRERAHSTLGTPADSEGPPAVFSGGRQVYWDLWTYPDHSMQVEYAKDTRRIWIVTLMSGS